MDEPFVGQFFCCSNHSVWSIKVPKDLRSSPVIMKVTTSVFTNQSGEPLRIPVGGIMRYGHFVAITARGLFKYDTPQGPDKSVNEPPTRFECLGKFLHGRKTAHSPTIVGLFHWRRDADDCHALVTRNHGTMFDQHWWDETRQVLARIGTNHLLISISTERKFAVPRHLYDPSDPVSTDVIR